MLKEYVVIYWKNIHKYSVRVTCYNMQDVINHMNEFHCVASGNIVEIREV